MICTVHQPNYLPYLGFFEKACRSEVFILYDTTQFRKNDWQNRNKICSNDSWQWLSIPIIHNFGQKIKDVKIDLGKKPLKKNWLSIKTVYGKAPYFRDYAGIFEEIYSKDYSYISDLNCDLIIAIAGVLELPTKFIRNSILPQKEAYSTQALIDICINVNADTYISGKEGRNYLDLGLFKEANINVIFQDYNHPVYEQFNCKSFQPYMCILDLIFNCGKQSLNILTGKL
jgi:hypothetical protein